MVKADSAKRRKSGGSRLFRKRTCRRKLPQTTAETENSTTTKHNVEDDVVSTLPTTNENSQEPSSGSKNKITLEKPAAHSDDNEWHYMIINSSIFKNLINSLACPECHRTNIEFHNDESKKMGFSNFIILTCNDCPWEVSSFTSKPIENKEPFTPGVKKFDINLRTVLAFREIGKGYDAIEKHSGFMNFSPPMNKSAFQKTQDHLVTHYKSVANKSMLDVSMNE